MKNPIKVFKQAFHHNRAMREKKRQQAEFQKQLEAISLVFETFNKFRDGGLLFFDSKHQIVYISSVLSYEFIYDDIVWRDFLHKLHLWAAFDYQLVEYRNAYTRYLADAEAKAASKAGRPLDASAVKVARMEAAERFDSENVYQECPDIQFVVLGSSGDQKPLMVARYVNGEYVTNPVKNEE